MGRTRTLAEAVRDGLLFVDKIKLNVSVHDRDTLKQYFIEKGYSVESVAESVDDTCTRFINYYLLIGEIKK